jgi:hypothetical protein
MPIDGNFQRAGITSSQQTGISIGSSPGRLQKANEMAQKEFATKGLGGLRSSSGTTGIEPLGLHASNMLEVLKGGLKSSVAATAAAFKPLIGKIIKNEASIYKSEIKANERANRGPVYSKAEQEKMDEAKANWDKVVKGEMTLAEFKKLQKPEVEPQ